MRRRAAPPAANLEAWSGLDWPNRPGLQINELDALERLEVRTKNTTHEITVIDPRHGEILIRGGRFFPVHARARLSGASLAGSFLKLLGIYVAFCIELHTDEGAIVTNRVRHIAVITPSAQPS